MGLLQSCFPATPYKFVDFKVRTAAHLMMDSLPDPTIVASLFTDWAPSASTLYVPDAVRLDNNSHWPKWIGGTGDNAKFGRHCRMKQCTA